MPGNQTMLISRAKGLYAPLLHHPALIFVNYFRSFLHF